MYGIPEQIDLKFFDGQVLVQICFGLHDLRLNFDKGGAIHTEGCVQLFANGSQDVFECESIVRMATLLSCLLNQNIVTTRVIDAKILEFLFSNGDYLRFIDSNERYESFRIISSDILLAVV